MKQRLISMILIIIGWMALDYLFHGVLLMSTYQATASLWRPMAEMGNGLMQVMTVVIALIFVLTYCQLVSKKNMGNGIKLGGLIGVITGLLAAESFAYMPIPVNLAVMWFVASFVKFLLAGVVVGKVVTTEM